LGVRLPPGALPGETLGAWAPHPSSSGVCGCEGGAGPGSVWQPGPYLL